MWDTVPWTVKEWSSAKEKISLVRTRVLSTRDQQARVNWRASVVTYSPKN